MWTEFVTDYHISFYTVSKFDLTLFIITVVIFLLVNFLKTNLSFAWVFFSFDRLNSSISHVRQQLQSLWSRKVVNLLFEDLMVMTETENQEAKNREDKGLKKYDLAFYISSTNCCLIKCLIHMHENKWNYCQKYNA